jgi:hypothetical protein
MRRSLFAVLLALFPSFAFGASVDAIFKIEVPLGFTSPMKPSETAPSSSDSGLRVALKGFCRDGVFCVSFSGSSTASAFLFEEPDKVATGLQVVAGFLRSYWKDVDADRLEDIPVPLVLTGGDGPVFGITSGDRATVSVSPEDKRVVQTESLKFNLHANSVTLRLSRRLDVEPFHRAASRFADTLTVAGYSIDKRDLETISGRQLPVPPTFGNGSYSSQESKEVIGFGDYKGFNGALGAPVLNASHEVVGIQIGALGDVSMFGWLVTGGLLSYPNTAIDGLETAKLSASSDRCREICTARSGCAAYDHATEENVCRLFSIVSSARQRQGATAGSRQPIAGYAAGSD